MRPKVLFVTKGEEASFRDGFKYACDLAHIMNGSVMVLFNYDEKSFFRRFEDDMAVSAFAEAGAHDIAREYLSTDEHELKRDAEKKLNLLRQSCGKGQISGSLVRRGKVEPIIRKILEDHPSIEMVILSPSLMDKDNKKARIKKLLRKIPRPVVTMSKPVEAS